MRTVGIIPARMASSRFPGKPLAKIGGIPMIGHCYHRACMARSIDDVWVATCDDEIMEYVASIGGRAVMTASTHERASDRVAEAVDKILAEVGGRYDYVALIQGDEPMLVPEMLDELVEPVRSAELPVVNLVAPIGSEEEFADPNTVKVVGGVDGRILYFSREAIPSRAKFSGPIPMFKQLGMILFSRDALAAYPKLEPTPLEIIESVDMNRFLEHGWPIRFVPTSFASHAVDTPHDLERVSAMMASDPLVARYSGTDDGDSAG